MQFSFIFQSSDEVDIDGMHQDGRDGEMESVYIPVDLFIFIYIYIY